jgi:hypothetical protein
VLLLRGVKEVNDFTEEREGGRERSGDNNDRERREKKEFASGIAKDKSCVSKMKTDAPFWNLLPSRRFLIVLFDVDQKRSDHLHFDTGTSLSPFALIVSISHRLPPDIQTESSDNLFALARDISGKGLTLTGESKADDAAPV